MIELFIKPYFFCVFIFWKNTDFIWMVELEDLIVMIEHNQCEAGKVIRLNITGVKQRKLCKSLF